jgi:hypothetical protein
MASSLDCFVALRRNTSMNVARGGFRELSPLGQNNCASNSDLSNMFCQRNWLYRVSEMAMSPRNLGTWRIVSRSHQKSILPSPTIHKAAACKNVVSKVESSYSCWEAWSSHDNAFVPALSQLSLFWNFSKSRHLRSSSQPMVPSRRRCARPPRARFCSKRRYK